MKDIVRKVRKAFLEHYSQEPELYHPLDIEKVKTNEFTVKRFVLWNNSNCEKSLKQLIEAMKWRKEFDINALSHKDIPIEFFLSGALYRAGKSKDGLSVVYFRAKTVLKIKKLEPIIQLMATYMMNKLDEELNGKGAMIVVDMNGVSMKNANLNMIQFVIQLFRKYYPMAISSLIIYNNPWYLRVFEPVVKSWLSEEEQQLLRFASGADLYAYIDESDVKKYLFGETDDQFVDLPDDCCPLKDFGLKYGFSAEELDKYLYQYRHIIAEGKELLKISGHYDRNSNLKLKSIDNNNCVLI